MVDLKELEIRHLIALDAVATEGTFARAADRLGYTQSAISQQIASLERLMDARVFDRPGGPRPVTLTPFGEQVLIAARDLLARVDTVGEDLQRFRSGTVGRLTIGSFQSVSATLLPMILGRMRATHPAVEFRLFDFDLDPHLESAHDRGELDLCFVVGESATRFQSRHLFDDPFVLMARPGQFAPGPVPFTDISGEPMVGQHHNSCQLMNEAGMRAAGVEPNYVFRTNDNGTTAAMVRAGMGVAVMPLLCVDPTDDRIALHSLYPPIPDRSISISWRAGRTLSPAAERFVELAVELSVEFKNRSLPVPVAA
ncbi:MAG: LysR family transcriptional regulator [Actinobacteria bacterium]|nr:LysR family transcriptional regulator [Actinomycetota bacterium]